MKKLLVVIHSLAGGGAERVVTRLLENIPHYAEGIELHLAVFTAKFDYVLPDKVHLHVLEQTPSRFGLLGKVCQKLVTLKNLRNVIKAIRPDSILSFMPSANFLSVIANGLAGPAKARLILSERVSLSANYHGLKKWIIQRLMRALYPAATAVICVAKEIEAEFKDWGVTIKQCVTIHNAVDPLELEAKAKQRQAHAWAGEAQETPLLVTVGRLTEQKGQDVFIESLRLLSIQGIRPRALIFGTGELERALRQQIVNAGLTNSVKLAGFNANPYPEVKRASAFIFPSRWEGFPNALLEAMALGTPVIAADCPFGPKELIGANEFGQLVPVNDAEALAQAIKHLTYAMTLPERATQLREKAYAGAARFSPEIFTHQYLKVLFPDS